MTALLLLLAAGPGDTAVSLTADVSVVRLSGVVRLTLTLDGPAPLRVEPPADLLDAESAAAWKLTADGPAVVDGGRWARRFVADPFVPGEAVRLGFGAVAVWAGGTSEPQRLTPTPLTVRVTTGVADPSPSAARPVTGVESLADPPPASSIGQRRWAAAGVVTGSVVLAIVVRLSGQLRRRTVPPRGDPLASLEGMSDAEFAHRLSDVVRDRLHTDTVPARRLTTAELPAGVERELLERLDAVRFGGRPLTQTVRATMLQTVRTISQRVADERGR